MLEIDRLGRHRKPTEACGILLTRPRITADGVSWIIELPNRSKIPRNSYEINPDDLKLAMANIPADLAAVWHTHPGGLVGPSAGDIACRPDPEIIKMLVVALTDDGPVPTWF